jgi:hypothetical protein
MAYTKAMYRQLQSTIISNRNIRIGLVKTTTNSWRMSCFSSSLGAKAFAFPSFRIFSAFLLSTTGPYVSGINKTRGHVTPARMSCIQYTHLQETTAMYPPASGPHNGPHVVAPMNITIALPRVFGSENMSAHMPPVTEMGVLAPTPVRRRMMIKPDHEGASAQPREKAV